MSDEQVPKEETTPTPPAVRRFSLRRKSMPIELEGEDGKVMKATILEMEGTDRDAYGDFLSSKGKFDSKGNPVGKVDHKELLADLLSRHIILENGQPLTRAAVNHWPSSTQLALAKICSEMSGLTEKSQEEVKND